MIASHGESAHPGLFDIDQTTRVVTDKHRTLLQSVAVSMECLKRTFSLPESSTRIMNAISTGAIGLKYASLAISVVPSLCTVISSVIDLRTHLSSEKKESGWKTADKVNTVAQNIFSLSGNAAYIAVAAHKFQCISIARAVPVLQVFAASVFTLCAVNSIREAWTSTDRTLFQRMLTTAKEVSSIALGALGVVSLTAGSEALAIAVLTASILWITIDIAEYALSSPAKETATAK